MNEQARASKPQTVEEIRRERDYLLSVIENMPALVCGLDVDGTMLFLNGAVERVTGYSAEELLGRNWWAMMYPGEEYRQVELLFVEFEQSGGVRDYEMVLTTRCGERRVISWTSINAMAPREGTTKMIGFGIDVTERKRIDAEHRQLQEELLQAQEDRLRELSTPLIPISDDVLVMPLIGTVDTARAEQIMDAMLTGLTQARASAIIIDATGLRSVDTQVADAIIRSAKAAGLLGAKVVLTGVRPQMAQLLVELGADLSSLVTRGTLRDGIRTVMRRTARG